MMDNADHLLSSVVGQISKRKSLQDNLPQEGPLPADHLQPDAVNEISLNFDTSETDLPSTRDLKRRNTLIHEFSYSNEPINEGCVLDVEASFSYHHVDLREICILDYETGTPLFHKIWSQPISLNFVSGIYSGVSLEELQKLQDYLVTFLNEKTVIGHNVEYDFDVIDRLASFKPLSSYTPEHLRIFLKPTSIIDTRYISWLLLPCNSQHPLKRLHELLCPVPSKANWHCAEFDSKATLEVIQSFVKRFNRQDLDGFDLLSEAIHGLDIRHPLKRLLNINTGREAVLFDSSKVPFDHSILSKDGSEKSREKESIDIERAKVHLDRMLNNSSHKSAIYEGQKTFIKKSLEGIHQNKRIAIESGTGTGKTFAYLASALEAVRCGNKAVVATPTLNLQDQVWKSALELHSYFKNEEFQFRLAQIIGSANFLSVQKIHSQSKTKNFDHPYGEAGFQDFIWKSLSRLRESSSVEKGFCRKKV
ncbi:MAG: DEAD/DEAH box helicase, partial [Planctomycetota bacterium]|nr:DEAD/DEAH box helicase [Planctomycetota bacterium]